VLAAAFQLGLGGLMGQLPAVQPAPVLVLTDRVCLACLCAECHGGGVVVVVG